MSTLEDKILGEKKHYYCSSDESDNENESDEEQMLEQNPEIGVNEVLDGERTPSYNGHNTGPKGVLTDYRNFEDWKKLEIQKNNAERCDLIKKLSLTCSSVLDDEKNQQGKADDLLSTNSDDFLNEYRKKRIREMMLQKENKRKFGAVINLSNAADFLEAIDKELKTTLVIIHIYDNISLCKKINDMFAVLANEYKHVKFGTIHSTNIGLSLNFKLSGLPAILVYKDKQLIGNFVRITDELGDEFCDNDLENFFVDHGILLNQSCVTMSGEKYTFTNS